MTSAERHLHAVPSAPALPWWCRTFGHRYRTHLIHNSIERRCTRCGNRP